jgi:hypothetical protein
LVFFDFIWFKFIYWPCFRLFFRLSESFFSFFYKEHILCLKFPGSRQLEKKHNIIQAPYISQIYLHTWNKNTKKEQIQVQYRVMCPMKGSVMFLGAFGNLSTPWHIRSTWLYSFALTVNLVYVSTLFSLTNMSDWGHLSMFMDGRISKCGQHRLWDHNEWELMLNSC